MNKTLLVARREYLFTVRRKGFIITTVALPLMFVVIFVVGGGAFTRAFRQSRATVDNVGIVDESGLVRFDQLPAIQKMPAPATRDTSLQGRASAAAAATETAVTLKVFESTAQAKEAFIRKEIRGYYVIPKNYLESGNVVLEIKKGAFMSDSQPGWNLIRRLLTASLVEGKLPEDTAKRVMFPPVLDTKALRADGSSDQAGSMGEVTSFAVPYVFSMLFMLSILTSAGYLLQGVSEEKENRVIEVLLSSVTHNELLAGKVLGLGAAGLTQLAIWVVMGVTPALFVLPDLGLRWSQLIIALVFFLLGFVLFASLMAGLGSLGNNFRESQQTSMIVSLSAVFPIMFNMIILAQPNGTFARVLSFIPLTAPVTMVMRIGATQVAWWEVLLSATILVVSLFFFLRVAAKLFRLGTLMYGKRPSVVEIVRWLREA
jgi:ABC-2 type transport system permease protein